MKKRVYDTPRYSVSRRRVTPEEYKARKAADMRRYRAARTLPSERGVRINPKV